MEWQTLPVFSYCIPLTNLWTKFEWNRLGGAIYIVRVQRRRIYISSFEWSSKWCSKGQGRYSFHTHIRTVCRQKTAAIPNSFSRKFALFKSLHTLHVLVICSWWRVGKAYRLEDLVISRFKAYKVLKVLLFQALYFRLSKLNFMYSRALTYLTTFETSTV